MFHICEYFKEIFTSAATPGMYPHHLSYNKFKKGMSDLDFMLPQEMFIS